MRGNLVLSGFVVYSEYAVVEAPGNEVPEGLARSHAMSLVVFAAAAACRFIVSGAAGEPCVGGESGAGKAGRLDVSPYLQPLIGARCGLHAWQPRC